VPIEDPKLSSVYYSCKDDLLNTNKIVENDCVTYQNVPQRGLNIVFCRKSKAHLHTDSADACWYDSNNFTSS